MKYFLDTEFIEGTQEKRVLWFKLKTKPTIDLISIGIKAEDGREYYAISKDFNLKEAWNRFDLKTYDVGGKTFQYKDYWIRDNVLRSIWRLTPNQERFTYKGMKKIIKDNGKSSKQIAKEVKHFIAGRDINEEKEQWILDYDTKDVQLYGYYSAYDHVAFCWLFGKMIDLPDGFPMFAFDIQQQIEEYKIDKNQLLKEVPQVNCHNALQDAIWNKSAYNWIQNKINNGK